MLFFTHVQITHFDEITHNVNVLKVQMDDTEMSKELRRTAWCHGATFTICPCVTEHLGLSGTVSELVTDVITPPSVTECYILFFLITQTVQKGIVTYQLLLQV